jgi:predicted RND superfamily exporter protein|tara:strand:+ start:890 stop:3076 length:2187 start_codon:yes stop_codon:yes gene_type:complete
MRFLETPSGYRGFVENEFTHYKNITNLEEKYGQIDVLSYAIKADKGDIFQKDVLLLIDELTDNSWQTPYSSRVESITNHQYTKVNGDDIDIGDFITDIDSLNEEDLTKLKSLALKEDNVVHFILSENAKASLVNIYLEMPEDENFSGPMEFAEKQQEYFKEKYPDIFVGIAGTVQYAHNFQTTAERDGQTMYPIFIILIFVLSYILLRSVLASVITLFVIILSILPSMGSAGWFGFDVNPPLIIAPIIILTIALAHSIHIISIAMTNMSEGMDRNQAIVESMKINFVPVFLTSLTTAIGMGGVNLGKIPAYSEMANTVVMGSAYSFILSVTLLPILFSLLPIKSKGKPVIILGALERLGVFIAKFKYTLLITMGAISLVLFSFLGNLYFDEKWDNYFDRVPAWLEVKDVVDKEFGSSFFLFADIKTDQSDGITDPEYLKKLDDFSNYLEEQYTFINVTTVSNVIKTLNKNMNGGQEEYYSIPDNKALIAQYLLLYEFSVPFGMDLKNQMTADKSDSRLLVRINYGTASEVVKINDEIIKWINSNMGPYKTDGLAGIPVMFSYLNQENSIGLMTGLAFSFAFIVILVGFALRSLKYGLISIIPNIVPFILGFGIIGALTSGMIQGPHQTSVLISIGLVVDATIHFLTKYKKAIALGLSPQDSIQYCFKYVGYPIIIASICLFIGFLFLTQSIFISNYIIGGMCALIIAIALLVDLLLLPALLLISSRKA